MFGIGASDIWKLYETSRFNPNKGFQDAGKARNVGGGGPKIRDTSLGSPE